jgi:hypothetical protein
MSPRAACKLSQQVVKNTSSATVCCPEKSTVFTFYGGMGIATTAVTVDVKEHKYASTAHSADM